MKPVNGFELDPKIPFWGANPARAGAAAAAEEAMPFRVPARRGCEESVRRLMPRGHAMAPV
jgi:hypothetical protein